jgi:hypothetical protein
MASKEANMLIECRGGNHSLKMISAYGPDQYRTVVRWCEECGGVVVDVDCDGRIYPGNILSMQFPAIAKKDN